MRAFSFSRLWLREKRFAQCWSPCFSFIQFFRLLAVVWVSGYWDERAIAFEEGKFCDMDVVEYIKVCYFDTQTDRIASNSGKVDPRGNVYPREINVSAYGDRLALSNADNKLPIKYLLPIQRGSLPPPHAAQYSLNFAPSDDGRSFPVVLQHIRWLPQTILSDGSKCYRVNEDIRSFQDGEGCFGDVCGRLCGIGSGLRDSERTLSVARLSTESAPSDNPEAECRNGQGHGDPVEPKRIVSDPFRSVFPTILGVLSGLLFLSLIGVIPHETEREKRYRRKCNAAENKVAPSPPNSD